MVNWRLRMNIRDRVKELRRVKASELRPSPFNWRAHPTEQLDALRGILAEVGFAGASLTRELEDGSLELIDGHARAEVSGDAMVPVLILDVSEDEAKKILATFDPIGAMATADSAKLDELLKEVSFSNDAVNALLDSVAHDAGITTAEDEPQPAEHSAITSTYQILLIFEDEKTQAEWLEKLTQEGLTARSLIS
jgi:hypothetical protein